MIPVFWLKGYGNWDCAFPRFILDQAAECDHVEGIDRAVEFPQSHAVICIPGRLSVADCGQINTTAALFPKITFLVYGDEENLFPSKFLTHVNKKLWYFMPPWNPKAEDVDRVAVNGWPTGCREMLSIEKSIVGGVRDFDWCFMGQVTQPRREQCLEASEGIPRGYWYGTEGFAQGMPRSSYYRYLCRSKIALCPSGPQTPDSFRLAEALEAGCVPIADGLTQNPAYPPGYWNYAFDAYTLPFPVIHNWAVLPSLIERVLYDYANFNFQCVKFWADAKARWTEWMKEDLQR
jgi:hypothetical protein